MKCHIARIRGVVFVILALVASGRAYSENLVNVSSWKFHEIGSPGDSLKMDTGSDVLTISIQKAETPLHVVQVEQRLAAPVADGDRVRFAFRARSISPTPLKAVVELRGRTCSINQYWVKCTSEWKEFTGEAQTDEACESVRLGLCFDPGDQSGSIELAAIRVEDLGADPDLVAARAAITPAAVEERIRKIRTGDLRVAVLDAAGKPVPGADVRVEMTRSEFLFGCNIFSLRPDSTEPWQIEYQKKFTALLNYATLPFYWSGFERERGKPQYERLEAMARWCRDHGLERKGHPLVWHESVPKWAPLNPDEVIPLLRERVFAIIQRYRGLISYWDVLNEANAAASVADTVGEAAWIKRDGKVPVVATALGWAREACGSDKCTLLYNDYQTSDENVQLLKGLQERIALPDAIGIQSHMHDHPWPLWRAWETCERFAVFNRPIHFTEMTVVSSTKPMKPGDAQPGEWPTTPEGEAAQADYVEKLYTLLFSHPSVQAITWWDFSDRHAWKNAPAGLVREDMSPKPVYEKLLALIRGKWWTNAGGKSDAAGTFSTRAFYGDYKITVTAADGRHVETAAHFSAASKEPIGVKLP